MRNLSGGVPLKISFDAPLSFGPETKCSACPATKFRQDLPFWHGSLPKRYMVVAQDAGKGFEDLARPEFNTVFSIHRLFNEPDRYLAEARHARYHSYLRSLLPETDDLKDVYFTDLIKCAYSTGGMDVAECPCRSDLFVEMAAVRPDVVIFFGARAFSTSIALLQGKGFGYLPLGRPLAVRVNKGRELKIHLGHCPGRDELFVGIPQLGQNRYSNEGFKRMLDVMRTEVQPVILKHLEGRVLNRPNANT